MKLIALFLLAGPGLLAWRIEGNTELENWRDVLNAVVKWIVNNYLILIVVYLAQNLHYGNITIGFTALRMDDLWNTIYNVNFVAKYGVITAGLAVVLGFFERIALPIIKSALEQRFSNVRK